MLIYYADHGTGPKWVCRTIPLEAILVAAIRGLVDDLARGRFLELEAGGRAGRSPAGDPATALREYGRTLIPLPHEAFGFVECIPLLYEDDRSAVVVDLWTSEEGRSDLSLELDATKTGDEYRLEVTSLHVM